MREQWRFSSHGTHPSSLVSLFFLYISLCIHSIHASLFLCLSSPPCPLLSITSYFTWCNVSSAQIIAFLTASLSTHLSPVHVPDYCSANQVSLFHRSFRLLLFSTKWSRTSLPGRSLTLYMQKICVFTLCTLTWKILCHCVGQAYYCSNMNVFLNYYFIEYTHIWIHFNTLKTIICNVVGSCISFLSHQNSVPFTSWVVRF